MGSILVWNSVILAQTSHPSATSNPAILTTVTIPKNIFNRIEQQLPEFKAVGVSAGASSPRETWKGEEYAAAGLIIAKDAGRDTGEFARQGLSYLALNVTIHRYASPEDAIIDISVSFRSRAAMAPPKETYKGAALYQYASGGNVICQFDQYIVEITPLPRSDATQSLAIKVLDVLLMELQSTANKGKAPGT